MQTAYDVLPYEILPRTALREIQRAARNRGNLVAPFDFGAEIEFYAFHNDGTPANIRAFIESVVGDPNKSIPLGEFGSLRGETVLPQAEINTATWTTVHEMYEVIDGVFEELYRVIPDDWKILLTGKWPLDELPEWYDGDSRYEVGNKAVRTILQNAGACDNFPEDCENSTQFAATQCAIHFHIAGFSDFFCEEVRLFNDIIDETRKEFVHFLSQRFDCHSEFPEDYDRHLDGPWRWAYRYGRAFARSFYTTEAMEQAFLNTVFLINTNKEGDLYIDLETEPTEYDIRHNLLFLGCIWAIVRPSPANGGKRNTVEVRPFSTVSKEGIFAAFEEYLLPLLYKVLFRS